MHFRKVGPTRHDPCLSVDVICARSCDTWRIAPSRAHAR